MLGRSRDANSPRERVSAVLTGCESLRESRRHLRANGRGRELSRDYEHVPMKVHVLEYGMAVPVPLERAFAVFENPYNLLRITPPWLNLRITIFGHRQRALAAILTGAPTVQ